MKRRGSRLLVAGLLAVTTIAVPTWAGAASAATPAATPAATSATTPAVTSAPDGVVTLITGDRVTVQAGRVRVEPGPGREHLGFASSTDERGDLHVVPADVTADVAAGRLDARLFDVSGLLRHGYDDASMPATPLIVTRGTALRAAGARDVRALSSVDGYALSADKSTPFLSGARAAGVGRVWLDGPVRAALDRSTAQIGAPAAWRSGHTGAGTTVAVLDSGVDEAHPDLAGAVVGSHNFTPTDSATDRNGHGTHVAATITGSGRYQGVAPDSAVLNGKVLDDSGYGWESGIIAGMEWAVAADADVVNMSIVTPLPTDGKDLLSAAVDRLTAQSGTLFVVSAGNRGPDTTTITGPAAADAALAVGAVDRAGGLAAFSSRGPRLGDGALKPDITAPGVDIVAARAAGAWNGQPVDELHSAMSGTSMAAPHVAGAAAILAGLHPDWTAEQLKSALMGSAGPNPALTVHEQGAGLVDVAAAVTRSVTAAPASASFGTTTWPHHDDAPIVRTVTYRNSGTAPVTLRITSDVRDPAGNPAPAGTLTASPQEVPVPAGGTAAVTVTVDTSLDAPDGEYGGALVATGDGASVRVPVGFTRERESYDVALRFLDHDGNPAADYSFRLAELDRPTAHEGYDSSGTVVLRVPRGGFYFEGGVNTWVGDEYRTTWFAEPAVTVTRDTELVLDARRGRPVTFAVDRPGAAVGYASASFVVRTGWGDTGVGVGGEGFEQQHWAPSTTSAPGRASFTATAQLAEPDGAGGFDGSPYQYNLTWAHDGGVPDRLDRAFADRDLAEVAMPAAAQAPGRTGTYDSLVRGPLPRRVTQHFSPGSPWHTVFTQQRGGVAQDSQATTKPRVFGVGAQRPERWNAAVFSPAFPPAERPYQWARRTGDDVRINVPMFSDQHPNHYGHSTVDTARTELRRDGVLLAESAQPGRLNTALPADEGTYELTAHATRGSVADLSTAVSARWTFTSGHAPGPDPIALPLPAVRFAPVLDEHDRAPAGRPFAIPVYAQRSGSEATAGVRTPAVEVSYDDGTSWTAARVARVGARWVALVHHPTGARFASLRASTRDDDGNSVETTVIRAYHLK